MEKGIKVSRGVIALLRKHLRARERGKALYKLSGAALDLALLSNKVPIGVPITIKFRVKGETFERKVVIVDNFETDNRAFRTTMFSRYEVEDYKAPKPEKKSKAEPAVAHTAEVGA